MSLDQQSHSREPIEEGWQILLLTLPDLADEVLDLLRFVYFSGANRYRTMVRNMFEFTDAEQRTRMLVDLATEINNWVERERHTLVRWKPRNDGRGTSHE